LVAKVKSEKQAESVIQYLKQKHIDARFADGAQFDLYSHTEVPGVGIYVEPDDVKQAAKRLRLKFKGLSFDPYVSTSK
jgi:hypothetical protein